MTDEIDDRLIERLGLVHARQRIGIEEEMTPRVFGGGLNFFHPENWYSAHSVMRYILKLSGTYWPGRNQARNIQVRTNKLPVANLPVNFEDFTILHLSDIHADMDPAATRNLEEKLDTLEYDICVITGDVRAQTSGPIDPAMREMRSLSSVLREPVYAVLGNHDSIRMVPDLEEMGIRMLLNESLHIERQGAVLHLAGIDDAHYYRVDNIEKAAMGIPHDAASILLSHTPEVYRQAAHAGFDAMLCGHTHGGQICLPGGYPLTLDASCPKSMGSGNWRHHTMAGYTSVGAGTSIVEVRLNCPPEVTLHRLYSI
ncbi:MAG: metallophosphoesterase [Pseudomonadota bacterium]